MPTNSTVNFEQVGIIESTPVTIDNIQGYGTGLDWNPDYAPASASKDVVTARFLIYRETERSDKLTAYYYLKPQMKVVSSDYEKTIEYGTGVTMGEVTGINISFGGQTITTMPYGISANIDKLPATGMSAEDFYNTNVCANPNEEWKDVNLGLGMSGAPQGATLPFAPQSEIGVDPDTILSIQVDQRGQALTLSGSFNAVLYRWSYDSRNLIGAYTFEFNSAIQSYRPYTGIEEPTYCYPCNNSIDVDAPVDFSFIFNGERLGAYNLFLYDYDTNESKGNIGWQYFQNYYAYNGDEIVIQRPLNSITSPLSNNKSYYWKLELSPYNTSLLAGEKPTYMTNGFYFNTENHNINLFQYEPYIPQGTSDKDMIVTPLPSIDTLVHENSSSYPNHVITAWKYFANSLSPENGKIFFNFHQGFTVKADLIGRGLIRNFAIRIVDGEGCIRSTILNDNTEYSSSHRYSLSSDFIGGELPANQDCSVRITYQLLDDTYVKFSIENPAINISQSEFPSINIKGNFSGSSNSGLKYYNYSLYSLYGAEEFSSSNIYSSDLDIKLPIISSKINKLVVCSGTINEGVGVQEFDLNIAEPHFKNNIVLIDDKRRNAVKIMLPYSEIINGASIYIRRKLIEEDSYVLIGDQLTTSDFTLETIDGGNGNSISYYSIYDYGAANNHCYQYEIIQNKDYQAPSFLGGVVTTDWEGIALYPLSYNPETEKYSLTYRNKQLFDIGSTSESTSDYWKFYLDINEENISLVQDKTFVATFNRTPKVLKGKSGYLTGGLSCYLGNMETTQSGEHYFEPYKMVDKWQDFLNTNSLCLYKNLKGDTIIVMINSDSTRTYQNSYINHYTDKNSLYSFNLYDSGGGLASTNYQQDITDRPSIIQFGFTEIDDIEKLDPLLKV